MKFLVLWHLGAGQPGPEALADKSDPATVIGKKAG